MNIGMRLPRRVAHVAAHAAAAANVVERGGGACRRHSRRGHGQPRLRTSLSVRSLGPGRALNLVNLRDVGGGSRARGGGAATPPRRLLAVPAAS